MREVWVCNVRSPAPGALSTSREPIDVAYCICLNTQQYVFDPYSKQIQLFIWIDIFPTGFFSLVICGWRNIFGIAMWETGHWMEMVGVGNSVWCVLYRIRLENMARNLIFHSKSMWTVNIWNKKRKINYRWIAVLKTRHNSFDCGLHYYPYTLHVTHQTITVHHFHLVIEISTFSIQQ